MKIGVITYHKAYNYGSALQAFALNHYLKELGHEAEVINFHTYNQDRLYDIFEKNNSIMSIARNIQSLWHYRALCRHKRRFDEFLNKHVIVGRENFDEKSDLSVLNNRYDMFICGSDQIWCTSCADFSYAYCFDFVKEKNKCLSYAASLGGGIAAECELKFSNLLTGFHAISTREQSGALVLQRIVKREIEVVPDPVVLLDVDTWQSITPGKIINDPYILCYFIGDVEGMREYAVKMRKQSGLKLVVIYKSIRDVLYMNKKRYDSGPLEFLSLIKHSKYICTNSFHAVVFATLFQKDFWVFSDLKPGNAGSRIEDFCRALNLSDRILNQKKSLPDDVTNSIDYTNVPALLDKLRKKGRTFLQRNLGETR